MGKKVFPAHGMNPALTAKNPKFPPNLQRFFCSLNHTTSLAAALSYQQIPKVCTQHSGTPHSLCVYIYIYKHSGINIYI